LVQTVLADNAKRKALGVGRVAQDEAVVEAGKGV
jgi:hypothetical protein